MKLAALLLVCLAACGYVQAKPVYKDRDINDKDVIEAAEYAATFIHEAIYLQNYLKLSFLVGAQSAELDGEEEQWHVDGTFYKLRAVYGETNCSKDKELTAEDIKEKCEIKADDRLRRCYAEVHRDVDGIYERGSYIVACKFDDE